MTKSVLLMKGLQSAIPLTSFQGCPVVSKIGNTGKVRNKYTINTVTVTVTASENSYNTQSSDSYYVTFFFFFNI